MSSIILRRLSIFVRANDNWDWRDFLSMNLWQLGLLRGWRCQRIPLLHQFLLCGSWSFISAGWRWIPVFADGFQFSTFGYLDVSLDHGLLLQFLLIRLLEVVLDVISCSSISGLVYETIIFLSNFVGIRVQIRLGNASPIHHLRIALK